MGFLKFISNSGRSETWLRFSAEIGADFVMGKSGKNDKIVTNFREWTITLDTLAVAVPGGACATYTRMMAPYVNRDGFRFRICRRRIPYRIAKKFQRMRGVEVGDTEFDGRFIVKGNDESSIRALFANARIRMLIQSQPHIDLEVRHDRDGMQPSFPDGIDQLYFHENGIIRDVERLRSLYDLFAEILDNLCFIGSAGENTTKSLSENRRLSRRSLYRNQVFG